MIFSEIVRQDQFCYETCVKDSDCNNQEICLNGECQSGCTSDNHCPEGLKCFRKSCVTTCSRGTGMSLYRSISSNHFYYISTHDVSNFHLFISQ